MIEGLAYVKVTAEMVSKLMDRNLIPTDAAAGKYLLRYVEEFFCGHSDVKLPKQLANSFELAEVDNIKKYRTAVLNGSKSHQGQGQQPAETSNLGRTDPQADPQDPKDIDTYTPTAHSPQQPYVYGNGETLAQSQRPVYTYQNPPTLDEVFDTVEREEMDLPWESIERWHSDHSYNGWVNQQGEPIKYNVIDKSTGERIPGWLAMLRGLDRKAKRDMGVDDA